MDHCPPSGAAGGTIGSIVPEPPELSPELLLELSPELLPPELLPPELSPPELLPPELFPELLPPELFPLDPPFPESLSLESSLSEESSSFSSVSSSLGAT